MLELSGLLTPYSASSEVVWGWEGDPNEKAYKHVLGPLYLPPSSACLPAGPTHTL